MNKLTPTQWRERAMLLGRIVEALSNVTDLPILRETLEHCETQRGRAIGHAIKARKEKLGSATAREQQVQRADTPSFDPDNDDNGDAWQ